VRGIVPAGSPARGYAPPVGAGPYKIDDLSPDGEAVFSAYDGYYGGPPAIRAVTVKFVPDSNVRFLELKMGSVNFTLNGVDPDLLPAASMPGRLVVEEGPGGNVTYLGFNLRDRALSDARVRRAIALAIDRETIVRTIWKGRADLVSSILPPGSWANDPDLSAAPFDPARARRLLDEAGLPAGTMPRTIVERKGANGSERRKTTVRGSGVSIAARCRYSPRWGDRFAASRIHVKVYRTSAEVSGRPSWNRNPGRRWNMCVRGSGDSHRSARSGTGSPAASRRTREACVIWRICSP